MISSKLLKFSSKVIVSQPVAQRNGLNLFSKQSLRQFSTEQKLLQNWSFNVTYSSQTELHPTSIVQLQEILQKYNQVKVQGTSTAFTKSSDTFRDGVIVKLDHFKDVKVDKANNTVTFGPGVIWRELADQVHAQGKALTTAIACQQINVVGSVVNGCHGSGLKNQILASQIIAFDMVFADGSMRTITEKDQDFYFYLINFGTVGVITKMTMKVKDPYYLVMKHIHNVDWHTQYQELDKQYLRMDSFASLDEPKIEYVWAAKECPKDHVYVESAEEKAEFQRMDEWNKSKGRDFFFVAGRGVGTSRDKIFLFEQDIPPESGIQNEFFCPYDKFATCIQTLYEKLGSVWPGNLGALLRSVGKDNIPFSGAKGRDVVAINLNQLHVDEDTNNKTTQILEAFLDQFDCKPHFGKHYVQSHQQFKHHYGEDLEHLKRIATKYDPTGKFHNAHFRKYVLGETK